MLQMNTYTLPLALKCNQFEGENAHLLARIAEQSGHISNLESIVSQLESTVALLEGELSEGNSRVEKVKRARKEESDKLAKSSAEESDIKQTVIDSLTIRLGEL